jgi:acyl-CoA synthetase (AMP-forming)/AMP-acid ligase II
MIPGSMSHHFGDQSEPVLETTVGGALRQAVVGGGYRVALIEGGAVQAERRRWSFADLLRDAEHVARWLLGLFEPGEHVAVWAPNSPEWVLLEFGAALAGLTLVTVNPAYLAKELEYVLKQSGAAGLFVVPEYRGRDLFAVVREVRPALPSLRHVAALGDWHAGAEAPVAHRELPAVTPDDIAQIQYTSGTTGFPKGALLSHRGLTNNARFFAGCIGATHDDIWVNPMPLFHTAGCGLVTLGALQTGGAHVIPPGFDAALMLDLIEAERGTIVLGVPTMLIGMLENLPSKNRDLSSLRLAASGGAPVSPELVARAQRLLGVRFAIGYGQTEASPYITHTAADDGSDGWESTVGRPLPQCEVKIVNPESGSTVPSGQPGEICTRGYAVMKGYFNNPEATAKALDREGWLHTGDLGSMDALGHCRILGRLRDMIIRGGENIYPREIEELLCTHPGVADAAVVGVPDDVWGEIPAAFIRCTGEPRPSADDLFAFCRQHLAPYKTPRAWRFVDQFPQTASGKVQKFVLRDQFRPEDGDRSETPG